MNLLELVILAIALSIDSLAVSVTLGMTKNVKVSRGIIFAFLCAFCQGGLLFLGELLGIVFKNSFDSFDHWIAFALLFIIGIKMLLEARKSGKKDCNFDAGRFLVLLALAIATSIDAFIVGIGVGLQVTDFAGKLKVAVITAVLTFIFSVIGCSIGRQQKFIPVKWAVAIGGLVLIGLGIKVLIEHQVF